MLFENKGHPHSKEHKWGKINGTSGGLLQVAL